VKESRRHDFLSLIQENQIRTLKDEPEALQYVIGEDVEEPNVFYIHEQFLTSQSFVVHRNTPHNAKWQTFKASDPFEKDPVTNFYNGTHQPAIVPIRDAYCLNVQLCIDPKFRDDFLSVIANNAQGSNQEPLCLQYVWGEDCSEPNTFHFHEQYTGSEDGKEGFLMHTKMEHFYLWEKFASQNPFTKPPLVYFYKTL
jgi:quinol monooxygenase YgiN